MSFLIFNGWRRTLVAALACAGVLLVAGPALAAKKAPTDAHEYNERLVTEFTPLVGSREDTEALVHRLRNGAPADSVDGADPVNAPLSYGEARYALKLAQGRLAQDGVTQPNPAQLQAALYGGNLDTQNGPKVLAGVLPQHARGVSWGNLAQDAGMSVEDLIPPAAVKARKTAHYSSAKGKTSGNKASKKTTKSSAQKNAKKSGKTQPKSSRTKPAKPAPKG
jgi:hypothetical protein